MKYDVCVFGGCSLDMMFYQKADGTYDNYPEMKVPGGKGANQAVAASRAGAKTTIITRIGKDEIGKSIIENLKFNMIDTFHVEMIDGLKNDYSNIKINLKDKDNEIERFSGAIDSFTPDMIDRYADVLLNSKIIDCQLKVPIEVTEKLINFCYDNDKILILTPCRPQKLCITDPKNKDLIDKISIITCNKKECQTIFNTEDIESCIKQYPNKLIVTLGSEGLIYYNGSKIIKIPAINIKAVDTVGAGDTFNGNLAAFLSKGMSLQNAIRKAMYASAMKIKVKSAQAGMPYLEDLEEFIYTIRNDKFEYGQELLYAIKIVKEANDIIKLNKNFEISTKQDNTLVTNVDVKVEDFLINKIKEKYPNDLLVTEENYPNNKLQDRTWIIDPIDGTAHFIKGLPFWGIQLCFYDKNATKFAVIYLPEIDELYYAAENQGAYINNHPILPKDQVPINQAVVEFGGTLYKELDPKKVYFNKLVKHDKVNVANLLHINSSCVSFTDLASGKVDALITSSHKPWDVMPGMHLCKEVGIKAYPLTFNNNLTLLTNNEEIKNLILG